MWGMNDMLPHDALERVMEKLGYEHVDPFAKDCGLGESVLRNFLKKRPNGTLSMGTYRKISTFTGFSIDQLMGIQPLDHIEAPRASVSIATHNDNDDPIEEYCREHARDIVAQSEDIPEHKRAYSENQVRELLSRKAKELRSSGFSTTRTLVELAEWIDKYFSKST
jgi:hypothetical protein